MKLISQVATLEDIAKVIEIANANNLALNPKEKRIGEIEARSFIKGFFDPGIAMLTKFNSDHDWQSFITLNPDDTRKRFYLDIYTRPGAATLVQSLDLALELARDRNPEYRLWLGTQSNDFAYKSLLESRGFSILRKYWTLEMGLPSEVEHQPEDLGVIREIDLSKTEEVRTYYDIHQDSFSKHFGFMPREFQDWCELVLRDREETSMRVWIISVDGEDVGFVDCNDELVHEDTGYVSGLGVRHAFHGRGLGEALLRHAIRANSEWGRSKLALNVDAGNESGALRLYEKVGMKPISEWHQYENLNWSE